MKRILILILSFIYFVTVTGPVITTHLCMGQVASIQINENDNGDTCGKCGMHENESCCSEEQQAFKLSTDQKNVEPYQLLVKADCILAKPRHAESFSIRQVILPGTPYSASPPLHTKVPIYIFNCVFTI